MTPHGDVVHGLSGRLENAEAREVAPQVPAVDGSDPIRLPLRVGTDQEIRDEMLARTTLAA